MDKLVSIRDVLSKTDVYDGWLYLPQKPWNLDTKGIFVKSDKNADPDSDDHIPKIVKENNWKVTLDSEGIEDIIYNAEDQLGNPSIDQLFEAFLFYVENDAFIEFDA
jgi:hypothetical protein